MRADLERAIHRVMRSEAHKLGCRSIAVNGTDDHVHVLVQLSATVTLARLVNQLKGVSSYFINENRLADELEKFRWQDGYGAFSISNDQLPQLFDYIANQKKHHEAGELLEYLEPTRNGY